MMNVAITVDDLQVPIFKSKIMLNDCHNDDGTLKPLIIEAEELEFKVCDVMNSIEGVIVFAIQEISELDDVVDNCVSVESVQKLVEYWQDTTHDQQIAHIHLVNKVAFDSIVSVVIRNNLRTFSSN